MAAKAPQRTDSDAHWDMAYIRSLTALDRIAEAQDHRWTCFCETLNPEILRDYLKGIPDFDDIEAEEQAKAHASCFEDMTRALQFFLDWPDLPGAARLIESRAQEMDGNIYQVLTPAADVLRNKYPLAAVLLWRAMIDWILWDGRSTRYAHAADHVMDCAAADTEIDDYGRFVGHDAYLENLRTLHRHKTSFWARLP